MTPEEHLAAALRALAFGDAEDTAARFGEVLRDFAPKGPPPALGTFAAHGHDPVALRDLPFHSLCAHHLLPFFGTADVVYAPADRIAGLGAVPRALRHLARGPQLQEKLAAELADHLHATLGAPVGVRLRARQMCMEMRGVESPGLVECWAWRGDATALRDLLK
ncbi:MAG: GTP cyclohydrolase I [Myxococcota bacterium]